MSHLEETESMRLVLNSDSVVEEVLQYICISVSKDNAVSV